MPAKGDVYYYIATSVRNGKKVSTKNIALLGKGSQLLSEGYDIDTYLTEKLKEYNDTVEEDIVLKFDPNKTISQGDTGTLNAGILFVKRLFDDIKLNETLNKIQKKYQFKYSLSDIALFLVGDRMITPDSKHGMFYKAKQNDIIPWSFGIDDVYRALDILEENRSEILKTCYDNTPLDMKRDRRILYYDCTNTYFESEFEDDLRARGKGKRNEVEPLVSFGLMMDASGIPLTYNVFKGSDNEQTTLIPLEQQIKKDFGQSKFIVITDAGLSSKENRSFNSLGNRKFITTLPVRKMSASKIERFIHNDKKEWLSTNNKYDTPKKIFDRYDQLSRELSDYVVQKDFLSINCIEKALQELIHIILYRRFPVREDKMHKNYTRGKDDYIEEDYIFSFSLKYALRQRKHRKKLLDKAYSILKQPGKLSNHGINDPKQYIKMIDSDIETGEIIENIEYYIDYDLIAKQEELDGYYCVATNLTYDDNETIISAMRYRWFIEDSFLIMKQHFNFRPVNHSLQKRIRAHFFTCFLSLLFYRYIQKLCHDSDYESLRDITDENILKILKEYNVSRMKKDYFIPSFDYNDSIKEFELLFNVSLSKEIMTPSYINKQIRKSIRDKI